MRRWMIVLVFAFLLGARIANADCDPGLGVSSEPTLLLGGASHHGFVQQVRLAAGLQFEQCDRAVLLFGVRVALLGEGVKYAQSQNAGAGVEVEVDRQFGHAVFGLRYGMAYHPHRYASYLVGLRYRRSDAFAAVDFGALRTPEPDGPGMRVGAGVLVGGGVHFGPRVSAVLVGLVGVIALAVVSTAPRT